jgi:tetratricopeptide (TPR) repeat protein
VADKSTNLLITIMAAIILAAVLWWAWPEPPVDEEQAGMWLAYGIELFEKREYEEALVDLAKVPAGSPQKTQALYYEGSSYMMLKDYESAIGSLEQALATNNQDTGVLYALGVAYFKLGNLKLAKGYFSSVLEINPNDEQAKGLMDIMAKLERNSVAEADEEASTED